MKTLVINGHPNSQSYCTKLASAFYAASRSKYGDSQLLNLYELTFNPNLIGDYSNNTLEKDLIKSQQLINWSNHIVFVYPTWWWSMPAILKGFIDRVFIPGFGFKYEKNKQLPIKLLKGKTATLIVTMDSPFWYYKWFMKNLGHFLMKKGVLAFCGIHTTSVVTIDNHKNLTQAQLDKWLEKIKKIA